MSGFNSEEFRRILAAEIEEAEAEAYRLADRDGVPRWWIREVLAKLASPPAAAPKPRREA